MSNSIHNTKVEQIKTQVYNLINDIKHGENNTETLQSKYNHLYSTSKTLFNFVHKEAQKSSFNQSQFDKNLDNMLRHITKIQKDEISQHEASENIGKMLAKQFIPQYK